MMVRDNSTRLEQAYDSLTLTSEHFSHDGLVRQSEEYKKASALLKEVGEALRR